MNWTKFLVAVVIICSVAVTLQSCRIGSDESEDESSADQPSTKEETSSRSSTPRTVEHETVWRAQWFTLTGDMRRGGNVGSEEFPSTFEFDWGDGVISHGFRDYVGFSADADVCAPRSGLFNFTVGSDDGMLLAIDGRTVIDNQWDGGGSFSGKSIKVSLSKGVHHLNLQYYDRSGGASANFDCDHELLTWTETLK